MTSKLVTIATLPNSRAQILKNRLESEGVIVILDNVFSLKTPLSGGVQLKIKNEDVEKAFKIMIHFKDESENQSLFNVGKLKGIKRILVPVDFSDYSHKAFLFAVDFANAIEAEIRLHHVYFLPEVDTVVQDGSIIGYAAMSDEVITDAEIKMQNYIAEIEKRTGNHDENKCSIECSLSNGIAHEEILNIVDIYEPELIIMGTRGQQSLETEFIGSVTQKIIEYADIPILAIPKQSKINSLAEIKRVMYATNFDESDFVAIRKLMNIAIPLKLQIDCVHITEKGAGAWDKIKLEGLKQYFTKVYNRSNVKCELISEMAQKAAIEAYIKTNDIDLISITTYKRSLIQRLFEDSITEMMLENTEIPLLVFHA